MANRQNHKIFNVNVHFGMVGQWWLPAQKRLPQLLGVDIMLLERS